MVKRVLVSKIVDRLRKGYHPSQVILFGSYANGRPTADSDVDMLIVKQTTKPFHGRLFEVRKLVSPVLQGQPLDPIVITPQELKKRLAKGDQFFTTILETGKEIYGSRN